MEEKILSYNGIIYDNFTINKFGEIKNLKTNHIYKNTINVAGYPVVYLPMGSRGKVKCIRIHKAIAENFIPNVLNLPIVHHINEDKTDFSIDNLKWVTSKYNTCNHLLNNSKKEQYYNNRKLTEKDVDDIRTIYKDVSNRKLAEKYNVSSTTISNIKNYKLYNINYNLYS